MSLHPYEQQPAGKCNTHSHVTDFDHYGGKSLIGQPQSTLNQPKLKDPHLSSNQTLTDALTTLTTAVKADQLVAGEPQLHWLVCDSCSSKHHELGLDRM